MHEHRIDKISVKAGFFSSDLHKDKKKNRQTTNLEFVNSANEGNSKFTHVHQVPLNWSAL